MAIINHIISSCTHKFPKSTFSQLFPNDDFMIMIPLSLSLSLSLLCHYLNRYSYPSMFPPSKKTKKYQCIKK
ncbi:hypothetical protein RIF29_06244 [Crotalaria pallida]|uniref:Uncharacterized protein n=1 Tax=Crotalaria pallida TaxID=3830 RepID=A0AAN9J2Z4_CROPI